MKNEVKYTYPPELQKLVEDFIRSKGLDFDAEVIIDENKKVAMNVVKSVVPDWAYGHIYFDQINVETYTSRRSYGILEVVKVGSDKDHIFIRNDLPLGYKINVHVHALGHADFSKSNLFYGKGLRFIKPLLNSSQYIKKVFMDYADEHGIHTLNDFVELCHILFNLSSRIDFDFSYEVYKTKQMKFTKDFPENPEGDILKGILHIPTLSERLKELIALYRDYMIYIHFLKYTKYANEGWASYIETFLPELWQLIINSENFSNYKIEDAVLRTSSDNGVTILSSFIKRSLYREGNKYFINLSSLLRALFRALHNPYLIGYFYYMKNMDDGKNLFYMRKISNDIDILMFLMDKDIFYDLLSFILPYKLIPKTMFFKIHSYLYDIYVKFVDAIKSMKMSSYSFKAEIPRDGISMKKIYIKIFEPYQTLGDLKFSPGDKFMRIFDSTIDLEKYMNDEGFEFFQNGINIKVDVPEVTPYISMEQTYSNLTVQLKELVKKILSIEMLIQDP